MNNHKPSILQDSDGTGMSFEMRSHKRLWAAVFGLGLNDAAVQYKAWSFRKNAVPQDSYDALYWINNDAVYPGSFAWLCDLFDIEPARARSAWRSKVRALAKGAEDE